MHPDTLKRIDAYLARPAGSAFTRKTEEVESAMQNAVAVVCYGEVYRNKRTHYAAEDCRVNLAESFGFDDERKVYIGDILEAAQYDPMLAQKLTKAMLIDQAADDIYELMLEEE